MAGLDTPKGQITVPNVAPMSYVNSTPPAAKPATAPVVAPAAPANIGSYKGVPITPGTDAQVAAQVAAIDAKTSTKPAITSSNSALDANQTKTAVNTAGNNLTAPNANTNSNSNSNTSSTNTTTPGQVVDPTTKLAIDSLTAGNESMKALFTNMTNALQMNFNAELAQHNAQYGSLFSELSTQHTAALGVAAQNAASLNPYSTAKGATTDLNFAGAINDKYQAQAQSLAQQASAALQALQAGNYKDYIALQTQMQDQQNNFTTGMTSILQNYQSQQLAQAKAAQDLEEFNQTEADKTVTEYTDALSHIQLPSPTELSKMTDDELMALPAVQRGLAAGYTLDGVKSDILNAAKVQAQDSSLKNAQIENEYRLAHTPASGSKPSASETKQTHLTNLANMLVPGTTISATDDTPVLDTHGYITPQAWKSIEASAPALGLSRDDLLSEFAYKFYTKDGSPSAAYGVTGPEAKKYFATS
jgi:hypothetical protein